MEYILGIDSGGTKYLVKACDKSGRELGSYLGPPTSLYKMDSSTAKARINDSITKCLETFRGSRKDCLIFICATTGIDSQEDQKAVEFLYSSLEGFECQILCMNDAEAAHYLVTGGVGALLIEGTGAIAFGRDKNGRTTRSGGWPPCIFGDEGSGTWMTLKALEHVSHVMDGRCKPSLLYDRIISELSIKTPKDLLNICSQIEKGHLPEAQLPVIIHQVLQEGDIYGKEIIFEGAQLAFLLVDSVIQKLEIHLEDTFIVGVWGSIIVSIKAYFDIFKEKMIEKYPYVKVMISDKDAAYGACLIGMDILNGKNRWYGGKA